MSAQDVECGHVAGAAGGGASIPVQSFTDRNDLYAILGLPRGVTPEDLRRSYLALCRKWNPSSAAKRLHDVGLDDAVENHRCEWARYSWANAAVRCGCPS
jgi:hypothetical protein